MRIASFLLAFLLLSLSGTAAVHAQTGMLAFTATLSLGSSGAQVTALQQLLNRDADTHVALSGPGAPGNESSYFGQRTKAAVIRFQEKYASEVLAPAGLARGSGYVGSYTRAKLNALSSGPPSSALAPGPTTAPAVPLAPAATPPGAAYAVPDAEKIDLYAGDKKIKAVHDRVIATINAAIASGSSATTTVPEIALRDVPSVAIGSLSPQSAASGERVIITGSGILANSVVYLGTGYRVRSLSRDLAGNVSFVVPPIPPARYDIAITAGGDVSNTVPFVVTDPKNPSVRVQSISPASVPYGGTLTISGSGFSPRGNAVVTTYATFADVSSADGKTLSVKLAPPDLQEAAKVGTGKAQVPMTLHVLNEYGFSDEKQFTMSL